MAGRRDRFTTEDLWYSELGDFMVDASGDLLDTSLDSSHTRAVIQEIQQVLTSSTGDWKTDPTFAADLSEFIGEVASQRAGDRVARRIAERLVMLGVVSPGEVEVVPLVLDSVALFRMRIKTGTATSEINLGYDSDLSRFVGY
jgi:hypothetical protein